MSIFRTPCTRNCEFWHPPECQFYQNETGCEVEDKCLFPHYKGATSPKRKETDDKNVVVTIGVWFARFGSTGFLEVESLGETRCKKFWHQFEGYDLPSPTPTPQASVGEKKGLSLGKTNVKVPHQRSPYAVKFVDRFHEETERQQRCARSKAWNLVKNVDKLKEKDKVTFYFLAEEWVVLAASTEPGEREFEVDPGASMHMVIEKVFNSAELDTVSKKKKGNVLFSRGGIGAPGRVNKRAGGKRREFVVDSGASMHVVIRKTILLSWRQHHE